MDKFISDYINEKMMEMLKSSQALSYPMSERKIAKYGWKPALPDFRNKLYSAPLEIMLNLPTSVDLRQQCPSIRDQGNLGSCTSFSIGSAVEFGLLKEKDIDFEPAELFIYYNERALEGSINSDAGASNADGLKTVNQLGAAPQNDWPYDISKFAIKPPIQAYTDALKTKSVDYAQVAQDATQMQTCLASGFPIVVGFTVYSSFESAAVTQTGVVPMPGRGERVLGGHSVLVVGYDSIAQTWLCRNSWGSNWGMNGYFTFPFAYLLSSNLSGDFWTIRTVTPIGPTPPPPPPSSSTRVQLRDTQTKGDPVVDASWTTLYDSGPIA